jgi:hypothetical protein
MFKAEGVASKVGTVETWHYGRRFGWHTTLAGIMPWY